MRQVLESGIRSHWIELAGAGAPWPCKFAEARNVILRSPAKDGRGDGGEEGAAPKPAGVLTAEVTLRANGIQDLADQIPDLVKAAVGHDLKFRVRVEPGGEIPSDPDAIGRVNTPLAEVSEEWKLE